MSVNARSLGVLLSTVLAAGVAEALPTQEQALALAFPGAKLQRKEHFLTDAQHARVKALAGSDLRSRYVVAYEALRDGKPAGEAFFDTHVVRTQPETALVAVSPAGVVLRVEVVQFREPQEYRAPDAWTRQLQGKALRPALSLKGEIRPLSGASLTAQALTDAARRGLALHQVLYVSGSP